MTLMVYSVRSTICSRRFCDQILFVRFCSFSNETSPSTVRRRGLQTSPTARQSDAERIIEASYRKLDTSFRNTEEAFRSKTNFELLRSWLVLKLCTVQLLVRHNAGLMKLSRRVLGGTLFKAIMKNSFYGHFVAGESESDIEKNVSKLRAFGVKAILDYSVEQDLSEAEAKEKAQDQKTEWQKNPKPLAAVPKQLSQEVVDPDTEFKRFLGPDPEVMERYQPHSEFDRRDRAFVRTYFYEGEPECDRNADIFCNSIRAVSTATGGTGLCAVKLTALGRPQLLLQLSEVIAQTQNFYRMLTGAEWEDVVRANLSRDQFLGKLEEFGIKTDSHMVQEWFAKADFNHDGLVDIFDWSQLLGDSTSSLSKLFQVVNLKTGRMEPLMKSLTDEEEVQLQNMLGRVHKICECAAENNVRVMVDAEQSYFQPAINRLTLEFMRKFNKERTVLFNTYQCYLKRTLSYIRIDMHLAAREKFYFGAKLVRGAYMEQERLRASELSYEDPIQPGYDATNRNYRSVLDEVFNEIPKRNFGEVSAMVATHNEDSIRYAVERMKTLKILPQAKIICFAQLYGMCDQVSFSLGQAGYSVYKYVPYGPVEEVLPYLSRRAMENGSMLAKSEVERSLLLSEMKRRMKVGELTHDPYKFVPKDIPGVSARDYIALQGL